MVLVLLAMQTVPFFCIAYSTVNLRLDWWNITRVCRASTQLKGAVLLCAFSGWFGCLMEAFPLRSARIFEAKSRQSSPIFSCEYRSLIFVFERLLTTTESRM